MRRLLLIREQILSNNKCNKDSNTLTVIDNRSGKTLTFPITNNSIKASDLGKFISQNGEPLRSYDPAYMNTICCVRIYKINIRNQL